MSLIPVFLIRSQKSVCFHRLTDQEISKQNGTSHISPKIKKSTVHMSHLFLEETKISKKKQHRRPLPLQEAQQNKNPGRASKSFTSMTGSPFKIRLHQTWRLDALNGWPETAAKWSDQCPQHPCMVYLPTFTIEINHSCRLIYHTHGWYGMGSFTHLYMGYFLGEIAHLSSPVILTSNGTSKQWGILTLVFGYFGGWVFSLTQAKSIQLI